MQPALKARIEAARDSQTIARKAERLGALGARTTADDIAAAAALIHEEMPHVPVERITAEIGALHDAWRLRALAAMPSCEVEAA